MKKVLLLLSLTTSMCYGQEFKAKLIAINGQKLTFLTGTNDTLYYFKRWNTCIVGKDYTIIADTTQQKKVHGHLATKARITSQ